MCKLCPENAYCAGDSVPGTTLLPVPLAGFWSNRSDIELVHLIHACPRGEEVCIGALTNMSFGAEGGLNAFMVPVTYILHPIEADADEYADEE